MNQILDKQIEDSQTCDFFKPFLQMLDAISLRINEFSSYFFSLYDYFFRPAEPTIVHVISYNLGTLRDYKNVIKLREICNGSLPANSLDIQTAINKACEEEPFVAKPTAEFKIELEDIKKENAERPIKHKNELRKTIHKIIDQGAEILCLQEVFGNKLDGKDSILPVHFANQNYDNNCAVAWNMEKFKLMRSDIEEDDRGRFCVFVDLKNIQTNKIIRVASHHLWGYNLQGAQTAQKDNTQFGELAGPIKCLNSILTAVKSCAEVTPDAIILGMDSNATPETSPQHFQTIIDHGFSRDLADTKPTNVNPDLNEAVKLDYLIAAPSNGNTVEITKKIPITMKNGTEWTLWNKKNPSDHLPIGATVTIK